MLKSVILRALALLMAASAALAQDRDAFRQEELDQMLAPIALYPDPLLSQILMASTYPLEVVQAARWSRSNPHLQGQDAVKAVEPMDWDPSVKSLTAFPQVLAMMDEKLDWTQRLGEAFIAQQPQVMDTIQGLRQRAAAAGNLRSDERARVTRQGETILIESASPQVVYVPYYDPWLVYGPWWWPAYPPVYWAPPPGYYLRPAYAPGFFWSSGIVIAAGFFFGHFDWPHRYVKVVHVAPTARSATWQHDPIHRRGVPYRHAALHQWPSHFRAFTGDARRDVRGPDGKTAVVRGHEERQAGPPVPRSNAWGDTATGQSERARLADRLTPQASERQREIRGDTARQRSLVTAPLPAARTPSAPAVTRGDGGTAGSQSHWRKPAASEGGRRPETRSVRDRGNTVHQSTMAVRIPTPALRPSASHDFRSTPRMESRRQRNESRPRDGRHRQ